MSEINIERVIVLINSVSSEYEAFTVINCIESLMQASFTTISLYDINAAVDFVESPINMGMYGSYAMKINIKK